MSGKRQKLVEYRVNRLGDSRTGFRISSSRNLGHGEKSRKE